MEKLVVFILICTTSYLYNEFINSEYVVEEVNHKATFNDINFENINLNNYQNIKIGDTLDTLISKVGKPQRIDKSEYDFDWYVYNKDLEKFFMVGVNNEKVVSLYSNSINSLETESIYIGDYKEKVLDNFRPVKYKLKGNIKYKIDSKGEYDIIKVNNKYITFFYDIHNNNKIVSYQVIDKKIEDKTNDIYPKNSVDVKKSLELQMIDLINSTRVKNSLNILEYSESATQSSRKHSFDMMSNNFFNHNNLKNETPFDRMRKENINYSYAGENIAGGQTSSIYAHEALMNSLGHRKNILGNNYKYIGVGIEIGHGTYKTYYTQNYYQ